MIKEMDEIVKEHFLDFIENGIEEGVIGLDYAEEVFEYEYEVPFTYFKMFYGEDEELAKETFDRIFGYQK